MMDKKRKEKEEKGRNSRNDNGETEGFFSVCITDHPVFFFFFFYDDKTIKGALPSMLKPHTGTGYLPLSETPRLGFSA